MNQAAYLVVAREALEIPREGARLNLGYKGQKLINIAALKVEDVSL